MTHADIIRKFMIEYDKANVTSSFPSLTDYEIRTILDKAYLALISLKITGNNFRKAQFELDIKSFSDILPLIKRTSLTPIFNGTAQVSEDGLHQTLSGKADNEIYYKLPNDFMYAILIGAYLYGNKLSWANLMPHLVCDKFKVTDTNNPWMPLPISYIENGWISVLYDNVRYKESPGSLYSVLIYIEQPNGFVENKSFPTAKFELSDYMAEELINLAVAMSLEIVESQRLNTKLLSMQFES